MIAILSGVVAEHIGGEIVLDVQGVGYGVLVTASDFSSLSLTTNTKLYIYENIKEDTHDLFGFIKLDTKQLFEQLLSVKNVGPKVAMNVLDIGTVDDVRIAIASGDIKRLQTAKGVGKRAAEQIVVELRDKVGALVSEAAEGVVSRGGIDTQDEAAQALIALGYSDSDAVYALHNIEKDLPTEQRIKEALRVHK